VHSLFSFHHTIQPLLHLHNRQRREAKACTSALNSRCDLIHIITNDAEPDVLGVLLDDAAKSSLCLLGHHIGFVEDDELVALGEECACFCELFDLFADHVDAAFVGCIELWIVG
jgi:hypothetical protein